MSRQLSFAAFVCGMEGHEHFTPIKVVMTRREAEEWHTSKEVDVKAAKFEGRPVLEWPAIKPAPLLINQDMRFLRSAIAEGKRT